MAPTDERSPTKRAIAFALVALVALFIYSLIIPIFVPLGFYQNGGFQPGLSFTMIVFLVIIINPVARAIGGPRRGIKGTDLTLIFVLAFATGSVASSSMAQFFYPLVIQIVYKASPQNRWGEFLEHIPDRLLPSRDPDSTAIQRLWEGLREGESVPWGDWVMPLAYWTVFFGLLFLLLFCIAVIVRRQLIERELLDYPMVRPALEVLRHSESSPERPSLIGGKWFWIAFAVICLLNTISPGNLPKYGARLPYVGHYFELLPKINYLRVSGNVFGYKPWNALNRTVFLTSPGIIALFYLLPAEASFSVWFFYLLTNKLIPVIASASGFTLKQGGGNQDYAYLKELTKGGLLVFVGMFLWNARSHLKSVFRKAVFRDGNVRDDDEPVSYRFAFFGAAVSFLGIVAWCTWNGMAWYYAVVFLTIMLMMMTYFAKQSGEMTLPFANFNYYPQDYITTFVSPGLVARANMVMGHLLQMMVMFSPPVLLANFIQSFKVAGDMRLRKRLLGPCLLVAFVIGIAVTHFAFLGMAYKKGIGINIRHGHRVHMENFGNKLVQELSTDEGEEAPSVPSRMWRERVSIFWMGMGGLSVGAIMLLRMYFVWWPFGPIGLIASTFSWVFQTWFSFFIAWALKFTVIKLGGPRTYMKTLPIVFGIMVGGAVSGFLWGSVNLIDQNWIGILGSVLRGFSTLLAWLSSILKWFFAL